MFIHIARVLLVQIWVIGLDSVSRSLMVLSIMFQAEVIDKTISDLPSRSRPITQNRTTKIRMIWMPNTYVPLKSGLEIRTNIRLSAGHTGHNILNYTVLN